MTVSCHRLTFNPIPSILTSIFFFFSLSFSHKKTRYKQEQHEHKSREKIHNHSTKQSSEILHHCENKHEEQQRRVCICSLFVSCKNLTQLISIFIDYRRKTDRDRDVMRKRDDERKRKNERKLYKKMHDYMLDEFVCCPVYSYSFVSHGQRNKKKK